MSGHEVRVVARATFVAAVVTALSAIGLAGAAIADAVSQETLVGAWLGPAIGDPGDCGNGEAEFAFSPNGTYRYQAIYQNCDPVMIDGRYELQADGGVLQMVMELCGDPGCPPGATIQTTSISASDPDTIVLDGRYTYHRQRG
jgi:hypothetical protein